MPTLTRRQAQTLSFIRAFLAEHDYAPSLREIAEHLAVSSVATVHQHVRALVDKGLIAKEWNRERSLEVLAPEGIAAAVPLPLLGAIPASPPAEAFSEQSDQIAVPQSLLGSGEHFALTVRGDSMIDDGIHDGDVVIVRRQEEANNGDTVAVLLDGQVTLKRLRRKRNRVLLEPANAAMRPIEVTRGELQVQGVLVALMRKYIA